VQKKTSERSIDSAYIMNQRFHSTNHFTSRSSKNLAVQIHLQCAAVHCGMLQDNAVRCSAMQCVAVCCSALQRVAGYHTGVSHGFSLGLGNNYVPLIGLFFVCVHLF